MKYMNHDRGQKCYSELLLLHLTKVPEIRLRTPCLIFQSGPLSIYLLYVGCSSLVPYLSTFSMLDVPVWSPIYLPSLCWMFQSGPLSIYLLYVGCSSLVPYLSNFSMSHVPVWFPIHLTSLCRMFQSGPLSI